MQYATARAGLVLVNVNPAYRPAEMRHALNSIGCRALVMAERFRSNDFVAMLQDMLPGAPLLEHLSSILIRHPSCCA
jgi:fatty-acyl-CoA synthase